ncbi:hypothetical protein CO046_02120 [Candidatus Peregrinibacteria bacterium CG_4_9_14_0_2_um_filter_53_11]|nr:MAG: hypothetical protein CO046_02120 [Candidatus Peregrinibacteria bacterium CG_4_9_14_0_2_um_filter_53_11]
MRNERRQYEERLKNAPKMPLHTPESIRDYWPAGALIVGGTALAVSSAAGLVRSCTTPAAAEADAGVQQNGAAVQHQAQPDEMQESDHTARARDAETPATKSHLPATQPADLHKTHLRGYPPVNPKRGVQLPPADGEKNPEN